MFSWGGVSYSAMKRGISALRMLYEKEEKLSKDFTLLEDFSLGLHPIFNERGEISQEKLTIIENGELVNLLTNGRTAKEFGVVKNGAGSWEGLRSSKILAGRLAKKDILKTLNKGLFISNLHYLNWSDLQKGKLTGMTRYACFYVEKGEIVASIEDLRFDESLYRIFGLNLDKITDFTEIIPNCGSYGMRSLGGKSVPGMIIRDFNFTL
jgi:predicted Zn-dependent protease